MLRPQDTPTRERKPLTGLWRFRLDGAGEGRSGEWFKRPPADTCQMAVPASFTDIAADVRDGADTYPGLHSLIAQPWSEECQVVLLEMNHRVFDRVDAVFGEHVWNFTDI
jgi:beta-galactosidase/beta-glucuronidase